MNQITKLQRYRQIDNIYEESDEEDTKPFPGDFTYTQGKLPTSFTDTVVV